MDLATVNKLLTTTRSVRARLDLTRPVPPELIEECLEIAVQAPQGSSLCRYQFIIVTDPTKRSALAELYRRSFADFYPPERIAERTKVQPRDVMSWTSLAEHFQDVPVLIIACVEGRPEGLLPERLAGGMDHNRVQVRKGGRRTPADSRKHDARGIATGRVLQGRRFQAGAARPGA